MKYIVYLLTIVLPAIKRVAGDTFVFQQDSAPAAHRRAIRSNCWSAHKWWRISTNQVNNWK